MNILANIAIGLLFLLLAACTKNGEPATSPSDPSIGPQTLKEAADFPIGVAVTVQRESGHHDFLKDGEYRKRVRDNFDVVVPINAMKFYKLWQNGPDEPLDFDTMDRFVQIASKNGLDIHGHTYIWYKDTLREDFWLQEYVGDWGQLLNGYIKDVADHFREKVVSVDVVNEAFYQPPGKNQEAAIERPLEMNSWAHVDDYIAVAFEAASHADNSLDLYYNDFGLAGSEQLQDKVVTLIEDLKSRNVQIDGIGVQMHISHDWPEIESIRHAFKRFSALDVKVRVSELDVRMNKHGEHQTLSDTLSLQQAERYREVVRAYLECVPKTLRGGITFWGVSDRDYYDPACGAEGGECKKDWPRLFDADLKPKPAYFSVRDELIRGGNGISCFSIENLDLKWPL